MKLLFTERGWGSYLYWHGENADLLRRINALIEDIRRSPFRGIGKPEPLKDDLAGWWSRRINEEHRLVYRCIGKDAEQRIEIASCRFHYDVKRR